MGRPKKLVIPPLSKQMFDVEIEFITPYLQHRMDDMALDDWEKAFARRITERRETSQPDEIRAAYHCYRDEKMNCYFPGAHIKGAMIAASTNFKSHVGNKRKSMKDFVSGMFFIEPVNISIREFDTIDKRSAWNRKAGARVIVIRPQWNNLRINFQLHIHDDTIKEQMAMEILVYAGRYIGSGSYRPSNSGEFGKFEVVKFAKATKSVYSKSA